MHRDSDAASRGPRAFCGLVMALALWVWSHCPPAAVADDTLWLTVKGAAVYSGQDTAKARQRAIEAAHREAIYQALCKDISVEDLFVTLRLSGSIMGAIPCGQVTASKVTASSSRPLAGGEKGSALSEYRVELKARVGHCPASAADGFWLDASLNKTEFADGDPVELSVSASEDSHYYVFNILEDSKVLRLVPNRVKSENRLQARRTARFPDAGDKRRGIRPMAHVPRNAVQATEAIYVLALRRPVDFSGLGIQEGVFGVYNGRTAFIEAMMRVVATIPVNERAEQLIRYQIKAKTQ